MLFRKPPPIYSVIDEYAAWKYDRHPHIAGAQRTLLYRFAASFKIDRVEDIEEKHIAYFVGEQLTGFYSMQALSAIRAFLWFCKHAGYMTLSYKKATPESLKRGKGRPAMVDVARRVKDMRNTSGMSYQKIADALSRELGKKVHLTSVARWYKKELPY